MAGRKTTPEVVAAFANVIASLRDKIDFGTRSKQMKTLTEAGYVKASKTGSGAKRRTWFQMTSQGKKELDSHLAALNALVLSELPPPDTTTHAPSGERAIPTT